MSEFTLKIQVGDASIDIQGETDAVKDLFREIRDNGLGSISILKRQVNVTQLPQDINYFNNSTPQITDTVETVNVCEEDEVPDEYKYPHIHEVAAKKLPENEEEWVLIYAFYASGFAKNTVSKDEIKAYYRESNRVNGQRYKDFDGNIKKLVQTNMLKVVSSDVFKISDSCKIKAVEILNREAKPVKVVSNGNSKKVILPKFCELNISETDKDTIKDTYKKINPKTNMDKIFLVTYLAKQLCNIDEVDTDSIFTLLDIVVEKKDIAIESTIKNMKNRNYNLLQDGSTKGKYILSSKSERYFRELKGE